MSEVWIENAKKDMEEKAIEVIDELREYAVKNHIEYDYVFVRFVMGLHKHMDDLEDSDEKGKNNR